MQLAAVAGSEAGVFWRLAAPGAVPADAVVDAGVAPTFLVGAGPDLAGGCSPVLVLAANTACLHVRAASWY